LLLLLLLRLLLLLLPLALAALLRPPGSRWCWRVLQFLLLLGAVAVGPLRDAQPLPEPCPHLSLRRAALLLQGPTEVAAELLTELVLLCLQQLPALLFINEGSSILQHDLQLALHPGRMPSSWLLCIAHQGVLAQPQRALRLHAGRLACCLLHGVI
jgi:hypothetical protein